MKKLITVIAAVFVGLSLNAASVSWNIDMYDVSGSSDTTAFTLYVFSAGDTASALASALNTGGVFNQDTYNSTLSSATKTTGGFDADGWGEGVNDGVDSAISVLILTDGTTAESTFYYAANVDASAYTYTPPSGSPGFLYLEYADLTAGTVGTAGSSGDIPEPTSGLLLLIGGSLLALRRKQK